MTLSDLVIRPGLYTEASRRGAEPYWYDADHVRFRNHLPEKIGGWTALTDAGGARINVIGKTRAIHDWASLDGQSWAAIATHAKLYLLNNRRLYDITPIRAEGTLTDPFTVTANSTTVTVTDASHGCNPGDYVHFSGAAATAGIVISGEYQVQTANFGSFTIEHSSAATGSVTGGGDVRYQYEIHVGYVNRTALYGFGVGPYSAGPYGVARAESDHYASLRLWSLDNWGEDLIAAIVGGHTYHWDRTFGPNVRAELMDAVPVTNRWVRVSPEDRHLIAFGAHYLNQDDAMLVRWSDQENFNDWMPQQGNTAGSKRLDSGSTIITAIDTRGEKILFTDEALYSMNFIGPPLVFGFTPLGHSAAIISPNAAVHINGTVYYMSGSDFLLYDGAIATLPCPVRNHVFDDLNTAQAAKVYASVNSAFAEVVWYYPSAASTENDRYVAYNYREDHWSFGTLDRCAMHDASTLLRQPYGVGHDGTIYRHEEGVDADGAALVAYLQSHAFELGDGGVFVFVSRLIPDFLALTGSIEVSLTARQYPGAPGKIEGPRTVDPTTQQVSTRTRARQVSLKVQSQALGDAWRMGTWRVETRAHGRR